MAQNKQPHKAKPTYNHKLARSARKKGRGATWQQKAREREQRRRNG